MLAWFPKPAKNRSDSQALLVNRTLALSTMACHVRPLTRIRSQPAGRFKKYKQMRKSSVRLVNGPKQIWRGSKPAYLGLEKWL